jgi:uncharacterized protein
MQNDTPSSRKLSGSTSIIRWLIVLQVAWCVGFVVILGSQGLLAGWFLRAGIVAVLTLIAIWLFFHKPRLGAVLALIFSTLGIAVGIAVGFRFLMSVGFSLLTVLGLIEFLSGIGLLVLGSGVLLSRLYRIWRIIGIPVIVIVVAVLTWTFAPVFLAVYVPRNSLNPGTSIIMPDHLRDAQQVHFKAADGVNLSAWYLPSANGSAIILRHGAGSSGIDLLAHADTLAENGFGVLISDARGHGYSDGQAMDFGWYGDSDIEGAVDFLVSRPEVDPQQIAVLGLSVGGEEAIGAIASNPHIAAVVAEGAVARTDSDKVWYREVYGFRGGIQVFLEWLQYTLTDFLTDASKPVSLADAVQKAERPVLLITAGKVEEEQYAAAFIQKHAPDDVTIWNVPEAGHIQGLSVMPAEWESTVTVFLKRSLAIP